MTLKFYFISVRMAVKKITSAGEDVREMQPLYTVGENVN
jgi:hypothetical protein